MKLLFNRKVLLVLIIFIGLTVFLTWQNNDIVITSLVYKDYKIPEDFNNFKILHISDLHNKRFGKDNSSLLKKIKSTKADVIVISGDLVDSRHTNIERAMEFIDGIKNMAPIYYVPGNHEARLQEYPEISSQLQDKGVNVLENQIMTIKQDSSQVTVMGILDPAFSREGNYAHKDYVQKNLEKLNMNNHNFTILLSHRPELMDLYVENNIDLVFTGHAHGGQIRLPFIGGLVAPDQGFFPKYTEGIHHNKNTTMVISRGLGNSIIPFRIFNSPELVLVEFDKPKG